MILSGSCGGSGAGECGGKRKAQEHERAESRGCQHRGESSAGRWGGGERSVGLSSSGGGQGASVESCRAAEAARTVEQRRRPGLSSSGGGERPGLSSGGGGERSVGLSRQPQARVRMQVHLTRRRVRGAKRIMERGISDKQGTTCGSAKAQADALAGASARSDAVSKCAGPRSKSVRGEMPEKLGCSRGRWQSRRGAEGGE